MQETTTLLQLLLRKCIYNNLPYVLLGVLAIASRTLYLYDLPIWPHN